VAASLSCSRARAAADRGSTTTVLISASIQAATPNNEMIFRNLRTLTPEARMAVTSLSAAMRLKPSRMPTSTPMGMVTFKAAGKVRKKISATLGSGALLRTTASRMRVSSRMKITNVNTEAPISPCQSTSFNM
jgi:hypothetical protein